MRISVIVPSKGCVYLRHLLLALRGQSKRPEEVILVIKDCNAKSVEETCRRYGLPCILLEQSKGYFTHALNMGKKEAKGDLMVFTDDDAIPPTNWLKRWLVLCRTHSDLAGLSSRDIYIDLGAMRLRKTPDDQPHIKLYRWLVRPWREPPHPLLKKYRLGVYITKTYNVAHGLCIPNHTCYSLPFRGVNMCFLASYIYDVWFPEDDRLKRAPGNEQYFGLQLVLKGFETAYVPNNPVLHIAREESLSRMRGRNTDIIMEYELMRELIKKALYNECNNEYA